MQNLTDVVAAREEAARLLGTTSDRWHHVVGVAAAARALVPVVPPEDGDLLVAAAWLHDIGYAPEIATTGFHPLDGARHLRALGAPARLCTLVAHHSAAVVEARVRHMRGVLLAEFPPEESIVADALTFADMTTSPTGLSVTVEDRLAEVLDRYPPDDPVHRAIYVPSSRRGLSRVIWYGRLSIWHGSVFPMTTATHRVVASPEVEGCCPVGGDCELLPAAEAQVLAEVFKVLADPTRVRLLRYLAESEAGTVCSCHLPALLGVGQPTLSFHMGKLHDAGLVSRERRGRWVHWAVRPDALTPVKAFLNVLDNATTTGC